MSRLHRITMLLVVLFALNVFAIASPALAAAGLGVTPHEGIYSTAFAFTGAGFSPNENFTVSAHFLNGTTVALPSIAANASGDVAFTVTPDSSWHDGTVVVTAHSQTSGHAYTAQFHLVHVLNVTGPATISPGAGNYSTSINVQASGFTPNEEILVAVFNQNGTGIGLPGSTADNAGNINFNLTPSGDWQAGTVTIVASGAASLHKVTGPFQLSQGSNGLSVTSWYGEYFNNTTLSGSAAFARVDPTLNFNWGSGSPDGSIAVDNFSARWTATANVSSAGNFNVVASSDDGIRIWVDGQLVIDQWNDHPATSYLTTVNLGVGAHSLRVEYYEHLDQALASVSILPQ